MHSREGSLGTPVAEDLAKVGVSCLPADNARELGWAQVKTWLGTLGPDGKPMLQFYRPGCPYTVKTLPSLVGRKGNPDDIEKGQEDHAADETRYAMMSRPSATRVKATANTAIVTAPTSHAAEFKKFTRRRERVGLDLKERFSLKWR
jgi:hypothetical protein